MSSAKKGKGKAGAGKKPTQSKKAAWRKGKVKSAPKKIAQTAQAPGTVVIGIIDDALCFAHERFRIGDETRVEFVWLQDGVYPDPSAPYFSGTPPVDYGIELAKRDQGAYKGIDTLIGECTHAGLVDEDEVYARAGLVEFRREGHKAAAWRIAHGTHVMDLAAGEDPAAKCDKRPIVCVQLPAMTTADTSGADLHTYALDAIEYILARSDAIAAAEGKSHLPTVINFSYGMIGGPHDGTSELEKAIDAIVKWRCEVVRSPLTVVLPAGNSNLSRCHAEAVLEGLGNVAEFAWRTLPDDWTPSFLEIWLPPRASSDPPARVELSLVTPGGVEITPAVAEGSTSIWDWRPVNDPICSARYVYAGPDTNRGMFLVTLAPTYSLDPGVATAPCGTWKIRLKCLVDPPPAPIQLWVRRDDTLYGHPRRGRQSHFDAACYQRFDHYGHEQDEDQPGCPVQRAHLLNAIATGEEPVVIGGFSRQEMRVARYSAGGPTSGPRRGPNALSVSDDSAVKTGVLAAGSRSGSVVAMSGTSVAAPQITRVVADFMAAGLPAGPGAIEAMADQQENLRPSDPLRPTPARGGHGRILVPSRTRVPRDAGA